jgi:hypothetical protein
MPFALNFVHPLLMWVLLGLMLYSGYLGYKASLIRKVSAEERKAMVPLHYGQRHAQFGAVILGLTLLGAAGGMAATFLKNGKLILGPHLFVGLAVAVLVIATASLGPSLQKGKDWARGLHVAINDHWSASGHGLLNALVQPLLDIHPGTLHCCITKHLSADHVGGEHQRRGLTGASEQGRQ